MTAIDLQTTDDQAIDVAGRPSIALPMMAWALNLVGLWPIGLVIAYLERGKSTPEMAAQYRYLIRTVWIGALFFAVSYLLCLILIGALMLVVVALWYWARCVKAMLALHRREPIANPGTWLV